MVHVVILLRPESLTGLPGLAGKRAGEAAEGEAETRSRQWTNQRPTQPADSSERQVEVLLPNHPTPVSIERLHGKHTGAAD